MITVFLGGQTLTIIHFLARNLWGPRYILKRDKTMDFRDDNKD
jgi:hypothetical protein